MKKRAAIILIRLLLAFAVLVVLEANMILGITYPSIRMNQPLRNPFKITKIQENSLELEDGRTIFLDPLNSLRLNDKTLADFFSHRPHEVEIERTSCAGPEDPYVIIKVAGDPHDCGTQWAYAITIPLIPVHLDRYNAERLTAGLESTVFQPRPAQSSGSSQAETTEKN